MRELINSKGKILNGYWDLKLPSKRQEIDFGSKENHDVLTFKIIIDTINIFRLILFFKWIKQHLKVKSFWGTSLNAVKIQVYSAIIAYCLVALVRNKLKVDRSTYEILQILSISLLDKTPLNELLTNQNYKDVKELYDKQLKISWY